MLKVVKVRLYLTQEQKQLFASSFGCTRWLWNRFLAQNNQVYKETSKGLSRFDYQRQLPQLKEEFEWLRETYSQCLQVVCLNLSRAFINFFEGRAKYPSFKSKYGKQSIQYPQNVKVLENGLMIPKIGVVKAIIHRPIEGKVKTVTISKNCSNQYFAAILLDDGKEKPKSRTEGKAIGIDLGLTHFATTSDNSKFENPSFLKKHEKNLKQKQKDLSRKQKGSINQNKTRLKVARVHRKITNCREDFLHKLSRRLVNENQVLILENLNVKGMMQNHKLAKAIHQVGWGMFCTMLKYKAEQEGKVYLEIDRFFPSSKTCNVCLSQIGSLPLDIRFWDCNNCGTKNIDRDINSARNIRDEGLRILRNQTSGTGDKAYCPDISLNRRGRKKSTIRHSVG